MIRRIGLLESACANAYAVMLTVDEIEAKIKNRSFIQLTLRRNWALA